MSKPSGLKYCSPRTDFGALSSALVRLWSIHPRYLDSKGLVALWREGLLAQAVLSGLTRGYRNHPQLERFREHEDPCGSVALYLHYVADEATDRAYRFDRSRLRPRIEQPVLYVAEGQLRYEWKHLRSKLGERDPNRLKGLRSIECPEPHPLFVIVPGPVAGWERA